LFLQCPNTGFVLYLAHIACHLTDCFTWQQAAQLPQLYQFSLENLLKHRLSSVLCARKQSDYSLWANCMSYVVDSPSVLLIILIAPQLVIAQDEIW